MHQAVELMLVLSVALVVKLVPGGTVPLGRTVPLEEMLTKMNSWNTGAAAAEAAGGRGGDKWWRQQWQESSAPPR